jgi:hypothetical protein
LITTTPTTPAAPLHTAPDLIFGSILFSVSAILASRYSAFTTLDRTEGVGWLATTTLLARLGQVLEALSVSAEHAPSRAAVVVRELAMIWDKRMARHGVADRFAEGRPVPLESNQLNGSAGKAAADDLWMVNDPGATQYYQSTETATTYHQNIGNPTSQEPSWPSHGPNFAHQTPNGFPAHMASSATIQNFNMFGLGGPTPGSRQLAGGVPPDEFWATFIW